MNRKVAWVKGGRFVREASEQASGEPSSTSFATSDAERRTQNHRRPAAARLVR